MKNVLSILLAVAIGSLIGYFGVLVSVFSDSGPSEQLITISIILLIYIILSALWGFFKPNFSWRWGIFLGTPGAVLLIIYFVSERNLYLLIYLMLIIGLSCLSAKLGSYIRSSKKKF